MPLTKTGQEVMDNMEKTYGDPEKAKQVFYASKNKGILGSEKWEGKTRKAHGARKGKTRKAMNNLRMSGFNPEMR
jgi:hypothetical protein